MLSGKSQKRVSNGSGSHLALELKPTFDEAVKLHQGGHLGEAEKLYRLVLEAEPKHFDALHLLGLIALQRGNHASAIEQIDDALEIRPDVAEALNNRGIALRELKRLEDALASFDRAIALKPDHADAFNNRGITLKELGRLDDALASFDEAIVNRTGYAEAFNNRGNTLRELNRFDEARASYDRAIALKPRFAEAFYNRGRVLVAMKKIDEAVASYDRALALKPDYALALAERTKASGLTDTGGNSARALISRGNELLGSRRFAEALANFDQATALDGSNPDTFNARGIALKRLRRFEEALASYDKAIALRPGYAEAFNNRGNALKELKRVDEALVSFDHAIALNPRYVDSFINRGNALQELERLDEALASYDQAIVLKPVSHDALNNRGVTLKKLSRIDEALASYDQAIALKPNYFEAFNNRGVALKKAKRFDEALASFERAIDINPGYAEAFLNRGNTLTELKRLDEAIASYDEGLALKPGTADAHLNRGIAKLLEGRYAEGWQDYEWRWKASAFPTKRPAIDAREWQGEDIAGRRIAVYTEQGLGDAIQFARYVPLLVERGAIVTLLAPAKLRRLLRGLSTKIELPASLKDRDFDYRCPLMSLPLLFGTNEHSIPNTIPYLKPEEKRVARWRRAIGDQGFKIGINWQGRPDRDIDRGRSIPLSEFVRLARLPGVRLISLQRNDGLDQLGSLPADVTIETLGDEFDGGSDAFTDCAGAMSHLDLILTSDTSIAHLAGALGHRTWVALKHVPDWRWLLDREDSPWYPTMRLFRQDTDGDWRSVFSKIERELRALRDNRNLSTGETETSLPDTSVQPGDALLGPVQVGTSEAVAESTRRMFKDAAALHRKGRVSEAERIYKKILEAQPNDVDCLHLLGVIDAQRGNHAAAIERIDAALKLKPNFADAFNNRGAALKEMQRLDEALASYDRAIELRPSFAEAYNNRGSTLTELGRPEAALASFDRAIALKPDYGDAFYNRGNTLKTLKRVDEAVASYDRAISLKADHAEAFNNRGNALAELRSLEAAVDSYDRATALQPKYVEAFNNRGNALKELKRLDEALISHDRAIALKPNYAEAFLNRGMARLLGGHFRDGWPDYEWRFKTKDAQVTRPSINAPNWRGEDIGGHSILVFAEQGLGDTIQFARYLPLLAQRGAHVTFLAPPKLARLFRPLSRQIEIIDVLEPSHSFDFQCALMSLPLQFGTDLQSIPNQVPYLEPEADLEARWKKRIGNHGFKIGIAWQGKPQGSIDRGRSIPLVEFSPLARVPGVRLISLQKHLGLDQIRSLPSDVAVETLGDDFDDSPDAFIDTTAVMRHLDLVITSDTSIAHLAGALARPTWVALKQVPDWRWLLERQDNPWYPTMRLFRQRTDGDWRGVFADIEQELKLLLAGRPVPHGAPDTNRMTAAGAGFSEGDLGSGELLLESANLRLKRCKHGLMMFHAKDSYIGRSLNLYGEWAAAEADVFQQLLRPGLTVIDAGANIGTHTLYFADAVGTSGRVLAFEPQRFLYNILCGNIALNGHANIVAENAALGSEPGRIVVPAIDYDRVGNFGGVTLGRTQAGNEVPVRTLDSYRVDSCQLIKIDVEGMEKDVLAGAVSLLERHQPFLYVENDREKKSRELIGWLLARNYRLYWHLTRLFNPNNYFGQTQNVFGTKIAINMVCVPPTKVLTTNLREITSPEDSWRVS